jgi:hypothetical protein
MLVLSPRPSFTIEAEKGCIIQQTWDAFAARCEPTRVDGFNSSVHARERRSMEYQLRPCKLHYFI